MAQEKPTLPPSYDLIRKREAGDRERYVWAVQPARTNPPQAEDLALPDQGTFESLASPELRSWVGTLLARSTIVFWYVGSSRSIPRPETPPWLQREFDDFTLFCSSKDVTFQVMRVYF